MTQLRRGVYLAPLLAPEEILELGLAAEAAGWDGFFIWDTVWLPEPHTDGADPMAILAALAVRTEKLTLGPMITPIGRRRPAKLARETVTIDRLSGGRFVMGVGAGDGQEYPALGEATELRERAERLDEGLELLARFWSGEEVHHQGRYFKAEGVRLTPTPLQQPRIPVWVGGYWPSRRPFERAVRWEGCFPLHPNDTLFDMPVELFKEVVELLVELRGSIEGFDVVALANGEHLDDYERAGATWAVDSVDPWTHKGYDEMLEAVRKGP